MRFFDLTSFYRYTFNYFKGYSKRILNVLIELQNVERKQFYVINKNCKFGKVLLWGRKLFLPRIIDVQFPMALKDVRSYIRAAEKNTRYPPGNNFVKNTISFCFVFSFICIFSFHYGRSIWVHLKIAWRSLWRDDYIYGKKQLFPNKLLFLVCGEKNNLMIFSRDLCFQP